MGMEAREKDSPTGRMKGRVQPYINQGPGKLIRKSNIAFDI